jgi:NH3-dependent NAD+ synthetase
MKITVGISEGVNSAVAAILCKEQIHSNRRNNEDLG